VIRFVVVVVVVVVCFVVDVLCYLKSIVGISKCFA
jgi:hypothetical protein